MLSWSLRAIAQDIVLAIVINTSATLLGGAPLEFASWYPYTCTAFGTNVLVQLVLPVPALGSAVTRGLGGSAARPYVSIFVENLVYVTCISLTMAFLQTPAGGDVLATWLATYVQLMLIGYVTSIVMFCFLRARDERAGAAMR